MVADVELTDQFLVGVGSEGDLFGRVEGYHLNIKVYNKKILIQSNRKNKESVRVYYFCHDIVLIL